MLGKHSVTLATIDTTPKCNRWGLPWNGWNLSSVCQLSQAPTVPGSFRWLEVGREQILGKDFQWITWGDVKGKHMNKNAGISKPSASSQDSFALLVINIYFHITFISSFAFLSWKGCPKIHNLRTHKNLDSPQSGIIQFSLTSWKVNVNISL